MKRFSMAMMGLALAGLMTTVSCRKPVVGFTNGEARTVTVSAVTENGDGSKTAIDGLKVNWSVGDQIKMNGSVLTLEDECAGSTMGRFTGEVTDGAPYYIGYPADNTTCDGATVKLSIQAEWTYNVEKQEVPMVAYAADVDDDVYFRNAVNMLKLKLKGDGTAASKLKSIVLTSATSNLSGDISVEFDGEGNPTFNAITDGGSASKTMTVLFGDGLQLTEEATCVYIPLAKIAADEVLTVRFVCAAGEMEKKVTAIEAFNAVNNMLDGGVVEVKAVPKFSVDASGTKVEFSPGNLQYLGKAEEGHKWRFAENQWDYMGAGPSATSNKGNVNLSSLGYSTYNSSGSTAARDLFGWGCTGYKDTRKDDHAIWYQTNFQPYSTSNTEVGSGHAAYNINNFGYGPDYYSGSKYNLTVENKSDWGSLAIGSDPAGTWRTLSGAEWAYLLNTRTVNGGKGEGKSYQRATINSDASDGSKVYGMLLYPDGYTSQTGTDSYTAEEFRTMEQAGVVFLPAAGDRDGTSLDNVGSDGSYWSSSCYSCYTAIGMSFRSDKVSSQYTHLRSDGLSVRLVR